MSDRAYAQDLFDTLLGRSPVPTPAQRRESRALLESVGAATGSAPAADPLRDKIGPLIDQLLSDKASKSQIVDAVVAAAREVLSEGFEGDEGSDRMEPLESELERLRSEKHAMQLFESLGVAAPSGRMIRTVGSIRKPGARTRRAREIVEALEEHARRTGRTLQEAVRETIDTDIGACFATVRGQRQ